MASSLSPDAITRFSDFAGYAAERILTQCHLSLQSLQKASESTPCLVESSMQAKSLRSQEVNLNTTRRRQNAGPANDAPSSRTPETPVLSHDRSNTKDQESGGSAVQYMGMVSNVVTVVGVVAVNKHIQRHHRFGFFVALSGLHFLFTAVALQLFLLAGVFKFKRARLSLVLSKAFLDCASVGLMNLCLAHNTIGTWQLSKLSCIPITAVLQYLVLGQSISAATAVSLVPLCIGIGMGTVTDVQFNSKGLGVAALAVLATILSHLVTGVFLTNTGCSSLQFLVQTTPFATVGMLILSWALDDWHGEQGLLQFHVTWSAARDMLVSCLFALGVNVSNIVVLAHSSALTYQVLGHAKTVLTLAIGFVLFDKGLAVRRAVGVGLALAGMVSYAHVRGRQQERHLALTRTLSAATVAVLALWPSLPDP